MFLLGQFTEIICIQCQRNRLDKRMPKSKKDTKPKVQKKKLSESEESSEEEEEVEDESEIDEDDDDEEGADEEGQEEGDEEEPEEEEGDEQPSEGKEADASEGGKASSPLKKCLGEAELLFQGLKGDLDRIENMSSSYAKIVKSQLFDDEEVEELAESIRFHSGKVKQAVAGVVEKLNASKEIWNQKKAIMGKLWDQGALDEGVITKWKKSMEGYENRIAKLDSRLELWNNAKEK